MQEEQETQNHLRTQNLLGSAQQTDQNNKMHSAEIWTIDAINYLENIIAYLPANIYWKDRNSVILGCNDRLAQCAGFKKANDLIGKTDDQMPWHQQAKTIQLNDQEIMLTNLTQTFEEVAELSNGTMAIFLTIKSPLKNKLKNETIGILGVSVDVTEKRQAEIELKKAKFNAEVARQQEEELRKTVMVFAGSMAHDMRTPLTSQSLLLSSLQKSIRKLIETYTQPDITINPAHLVKQLEKLLPLPEMGSHVVRDMNLYINETLKALEKIITGVDSADDRVVCSLWKCLQNVIKAYPFLEEERSLIHWDRSVNFDFMGNPILFYRVIFNLLKNSLYQIQQQSQGAIYIHAEKPEGLKRLIIKDTAGGIDAAKIEQLFKSYNTTKKEGTGIGLAFCKRVMKSFGGDISGHLVEGDKIEFRLEFDQEA